MIQNLAIKIFGSLAIFLAVFFLGYLVYENNQLKAKVEHAKEEHDNLLNLCNSQRELDQRISNSLFIHNTTEPSVNSFQQIVNELYKEKAKQ